MLTIGALLRQSAAAGIAAGNFHFLGCDDSIHRAEMGSSRLPGPERTAAFSGNRGIRVRLHRFGSARAALVHTPEAHGIDAKDGIAPSPSGSNSLL
jgi:hypothetical protein